jgi:thermitase
MKPNLLLLVFLTWMGILQAADLGANPNDPLFPRQKELKALNFRLPKGRLIEANGTPIIFIDSGIYPHSDLALLDLGLSRSFIKNESPFADLSTFEYPKGHGTIMAGIAAAQTDNGLGIASPAIAARIGSFKIYERITYSNGVSSLSTDHSKIGQAFEALLDIKETRFVVNCSFAYELSPDNPVEAYLIRTMEQVINLLRERAVFVFASGNFGGSAKTYPCIIEKENTICTSSIDEYGQIPMGAIINKSVQILAPYSGIAPTNESDNSYAEIKAGGTSLSAAYVSGIASRLWTRRPEAKPSEIKLALIRGGAPVLTLNESSVVSADIAGAEAALDRILQGQKQAHIVVQSVQPVWQTGRQEKDFSVLTLSPGSYISIYGQNLAAEQATAWPPEERLGGTEIWLNGNFKVPLSYVSSNQINLYLPEDALRIRRKNNRWALVRYDADGVLQSWTILPVFDAGLNPSLVYSSPENWFPLIIKENGSLVSDDNRVAPGEKIKIFLTGLIQDPGFPKGEIISSQNITVEFTYPDFENPSYMMESEVWIKRTEIPGLFSLDFYYPGTPSKFAAFMHLKIGDFTFLVNFPIT